MGAVPGFSPLLLWHARNVVSAFSTNSVNTPGSAGVNIMFIRFLAGQSQSGLERSSHDGHLLRSLLSDNPRDDQR